jgi:phage gp46-like protein
MGSIGNRLWVLRRAEIKSKEEMGSRGNRLWVLRRAEIIAMILY